MHKNFPSFFTFIDVYEEKYIRKLDKKIAVIYRNYSSHNDKGLIIKIKNTCKKDGRKFFLANNLKMAVNLALDGAYLPSFNTNQNINKTFLRKNFLIIGSAHSIPEIKMKEKQGVEMLFLSPLFKTNKKKKFLNPIKFNLIAMHSKNKVIALGGIRPENLNRLNLVNVFGFAGISYFKKNAKIKITK